MTHLILCREYPPAPYPAGGIGTYARHIARQLAEAGETVHVIGQLWEGAPDRIAESCDGRLIVHRISVEEVIADTAEEKLDQEKILHQLACSTCPTQLFSWQAARYIEALLEREHIDTIEAQEWEAPLYYLLARRAVGLGPVQRPPCIVHLHSPSQMIFEYNEWDQTLTDFLPLARFEEYTIRSADALLCPSRYLARQVTELFSLDSDCVRVIPYAMGVETPVLDRTPEAWASDAICYVGRLELRKGVIEWVDTAVNVSRTHATVSFDFFGADTYLGGGAGASVLEFLRKRIPRPLRHRFRFHGTRSRAELLQALSNAAIAVVPSRWENFPFTCIEAMSTGLPVLASPHGGMAEMIVDNESGWITADGSPAGLEAGLRRALAATAAERAALGANAAASIRKLCANDTVVQSHIAFRQQVAAAGCKTAPYTSPMTPWILFGENDLDPGPEAWPRLTYPGPPIDRRPPRKQPRRRYSGMALIQSQSLSFALRWFLSAPLPEKARWLGRILAQPQRVMKWLMWQVKSRLRPVPAGESK